MCMCTALVSMIKILPSGVMPSCRILWFLKLTNASDSEEEGEEEEEEEQQQLLQQHQSSPPIDDTPRKRSRR